jgi:hypothetical protein
MAIVPSLVLFAIAGFLGGLSVPVAFFAAGVAAPAFQAIYRGVKTSLKSGWDYSQIFVEWSKNKSRTLFQKGRDFGDRLISVKPPDQPELVRVTSDPSEFVPLKPTPQG